LTQHEREAAATSHYDEHYEILVDYPFVAERPLRLNDHDPRDQASRRCRFCRRGKPDVTFEERAHAVPEMLGNKFIYSMNECDACNARLAERYESHLGHWSLFARTVSQIKGKSGDPSFKNPDGKLRIDGGDEGLHIDLSQCSLPPGSQYEPGRWRFTIPTETVSAPYIPLRAAQALVKIACSVCPTRELPQCAPAIDWLMERTTMRIQPFLMFHGFTPGPLNERFGRVILLRRKTTALEPYLWCVVQSGGHRYQIFVPGCPADLAFLTKNPVKFTAWHYRLKELGTASQFGETEYRRLDWSGEESEKATFTAVWNIQDGTQVWTEPPPA
jgi:hypothetical protein